MPKWCERPSGDSPGRPDRRSETPRSRDAGSDRSSEVRAGTTVRADPEPSGAARLARHGRRLARIGGSGDEPGRTPERVWSGRGRRCSTSYDGPNAGLSSWTRHRPSGSQARPRPVSRNRSCRLDRSWLGRPDRRGSTGRAGGHRFAGLGRARAMGWRGTGPRRRSLVAGLHWPVVDRPGRPRRRGVATRTVAAAMSFRRTGPATERSRFRRSP